MSQTYPQYDQWTEVPQQHGEPETIQDPGDTINPPPRPPKLPMTEISNGVQDIRSPLTLEPPVVEVSGALLRNSSRESLPTAENGIEKAKDDIPKWRRRTFRQRWLGGLDLTLRFYTILTTLILLVNLGWFIWAFRHYGSNGGYGILQQGDCQVSKHLNLWLHLAINILSTGLLMGSSAFMAAATAPSREEIDLAHRKHRWLSIGLLSIRNLSGISIRKVIVGAVLVITSLPIHLFYNSVIFPTLSGNEYFWAVVTEGFLTGAPFNLTNSNYNTFFTSPVIDPYWPPYLGSPELSPAQFNFQYLSIQKNVSNYERLDNENCLKAYSQKIIPDRSNVILVTTAKNSTNSIFAFDTSTLDPEGDSDPTSWICSQESLSCDATPYLQSPETWKVFGYPISYCLSELSPASCSVNFSTDLAIVVIICNFVKLLVELYILFYGDLDKAITSVGDAIASFLREADTQTRDMCLLTVPEIDQALRFPRLGRPPKPYLRTRPRWARAISKRRWMTSLIVLLISVALVLILFEIAFSTVGSKGFSTTASGLWKLGFGSVDPEILAASDNFGTPITLSLLANLPQLILAMIYYLYNGMLTSFFTAAEYSSFASKTHHLRVASPAGAQQGMWLLGMPYAWGILFLALQVLLHWFVSQGFFVVQITAKINNTENGYEGISNCGFSLLAMLCAVVLAVFMMLSTVLLGLRRFPDYSPPVIQSNSTAVISAACHAKPGTDGEKAVFMGLKWGCVASWPDGTGHCSFAVARDEDGFGVEMEGLREGVRYK